MTLFPSRYIHVGGDEAVKDQWQASSAIQAKMRALGIANEDALQNWFIQRVEVSQRQRPPPDRLMRYCRGGITLTRPSPPGAASTVPLRQPRPNMTRFCRPPDLVFDNRQAEGRTNYQAVVRSLRWAMW